MSTIRWLGETHCHDSSAVGGKAATLSRSAAHHTVPPGFAIAALTAHSASMPFELIDAIRAAYRTLGERRAMPEPPVAVRSSALDEDGSEASFAGQHDTYLNIRGHDSVVDAVHRCVRSAASAEALAYRTQRGISTEDVRIAVLVQELIPSEVSAVAFSANPISGDRDEVMITASWGLGESIVGGTVTPDTFVVAKSPGEITMRDIASKDRMTVLSEAGGTAEVSVPDSIREATSLEDDQVLQIARLATSLETMSGHPVDIECAFAQGTLYLLQCRPITTLS